MYNVMHFSSPNWGSHFLRATAFSTVGWQARKHWLQWKDCWTGCNLGPTQTLMTI